MGGEVRRLGGEARGGSLAGGPMSRRSRRGRPRCPLPTPHPTHRLQPLHPLPTAAGCTDMHTAGTARSFEQVGEGDKEKTKTKNSWPMNACLINRLSMCNITLSMICVVVVAFSYRYLLVAMFFWRLCRLVHVCRLSPGWSAERRAAKGKGRGKSAAAAHRDDRQVSSDCRDCIGRRSVGEEDAMGWAGRRTLGAIDIRRQPRHSGCRRRPAATLIIFLSFSPLHLSFVHLLVAE